MRQAKRTAWGAALAAATVLLWTGCGDDSDPAPVEKPAVIPAKVAEDLAKQSDEVAVLLEAGDTCGAAEQADHLVDEVQKAAGQVPPELQAELEQGAVQLQNTVNCEPPPKPEKDKERDKDEESEDGGDGGYDEEEIFGEGDGDSGPGNSDNAPGHNKGGGD